MTQPSSGPATVTATKPLIGASAADGSLDEALAPIVAAVNALVRGLPAAQLPTPAEGVEAVWPADLLHGANMLAARVYRRKDSPAGVAAFGDAGPVYVQRNDPDIAMLLRLGSYAPPAVG